MTTPALSTRAERHSSAVMITGASGFLGRLVVTGLLAHGDSKLILPVRSGHTPESLRASIADEAMAAGTPLSERELRRVCVIPLPPIPQLSELDTILKREGVTEIIHSAGCVEYFDRKRLQEGNIDLSQAMVDLAGRLEMQRFVFVSTAYSSGYVDGPIPEAIHPEPESDPTLYTETKRQAERIVAMGQVPHLIVRPSAVMGDSRTGRYSGPIYGLYQLWWSNERFLCDRYRPVLHFVAPRIPVGIVHQDAFQAGFLAAYHNLPDNSIIHLTSRMETLPTMRDFWNLWITHCSRPEKVYYYERLADVPLERLEKNERIRLKFTETNTEITAREWNFATGNLARLRERGLVFQDVTLETIERCQSRFLEQSHRIQKFRTKYAAQIKVSPQMH